MSAPLDIQAITDDQILRVVWSDRQCLYPFRFVREHCQCAQCVNEWTGERILDPAAIPDDLTIDQMELVGNYAVRICWSDGHRSGLLTWERLRALEPPT